MKLDIFHFFQEKKSCDGITPQQWNEFLFSLHELKFIAEHSKVKVPNIVYFLNYLIVNCDPLYKGLIRHALILKSPPSRLGSEFEITSLNELDDAFDILEQNLASSIPLLVRDIADYVVRRFQTWFPKEIGSRDFNFQEFKKNMVEGTYEHCALLILQWMKENDIPGFNFPEDKSFHSGFPTIHFKQLERYYEKTKDLELNLSLELISEIDVLTMRNYVMPIGLPVKLFPFIVFNYIPLEILSLH